MDFYLDNIVIYSDSVEDHIKHVSKVLDILVRGKLYLSKGKLRFLAKELCILGQVRAFIWTRTSLLGCEGACRSSQRSLPMTAGLFVHSRTDLDGYQWLHYQSSRSGQPRSRLVDS